MCFNILKNNWIRIQHIDHLFDSGIKVLFSVFLLLNALNRLETHTKLFWQTVTIQYICTGTPRTQIYMTGLQTIGNIGIYDQKSNYYIGQSPYLKKSSLIF